MPDILSVLRELNEDRDRCALIGRNGLNHSLSAGGGAANPFSTVDYDIVCPDAGTAEECAEKLEQSGFTRVGATFSKDGMELDMLVADPGLPESVTGGYYNVPSLRGLWDARERIDGIPVPGADAVIFNKLLYARENEGRDLDTVKIYFSMNPDKLEHFLDKIQGHENPEERETMLYSLYAGMADREGPKKTIESFMMTEIENGRGVSGQKKDGRDRHAEGDTGKTPEEPGGYSALSNTGLYRQISLFMPPGRHSEFLNALGERMKDPGSADELMSLAMKDRARMKHFNELLHINRDGLSSEERQHGESFVRAFDAREAEERRKLETSQSDERDEEKPIERYSLSEERREKTASRKDSPDGQENGEGRAWNTGEGIEKEPEDADVRQQSTSMLSDADMADVRVASFEFLNNQAQTDTGLNSSDGKTQGAANASDELKGMSTEIPYKDAVISARRRLGNGDIRPPRLNEEYGPGRLSVGKQLALLTLSNNKVIAYQAKDFRGKFEEGKTYDIASIKRTDRGILVRTGIERDMAEEQEKRLEQERRREDEKARQASQEAARAVGGIARDVGRCMGRGMEM
jgi:hypothetical protein